MGYAFEGTPLPWEERLATQAQVRDSFLTFEERLVVERVKQDGYEVSTVQR